KQLYIFIVVQSEIDRLIFTECKHIQPRCIPIPHPQCQHQYSSRISDQILIDITEGSKHFSLYDKKIIRVNQQLHKGAQPVEQDPENQSDQQQQIHIVDFSFVDEQVKQKSKTDHQKDRERKIHRMIHHFPCL